MMIHRVTMDTDIIGFMPKGWWSHTQFGWYHTYGSIVRGRGAWTVSEGDTCPFPRVEMIELIAGDGPVLREK